LITDSCLHSLLPPPRVLDHPPAVTSRLRSSQTFPKVHTRPPRYCSFIQYGLDHYQHKIIVCAHPGSAICYFYYRNVSFRLSYFTDLFVFHYAFINVYRIDTYVSMYVCINVYRIYWSLQLQECLINLLTYAAQPQILCVAYV